MNETNTLTQTHLQLVLYFFLQQLIIFTVCITPRLCVQDTISPSFILEKSCPTLFLNICFELQKITVKD